MAISSVMRRRFFKRGEVKPCPIDPIVLSSVLFRGNRPMRRQFEQIVSTLALALVVTAFALGEYEGGFLSLFDGRTLEGWTREHTDRFSVRDGVIVNNGGS